MKGILQLVHLLITGFLLFGWALPATPALRGHIAFNILVMLHWATNNNRCFLSQQQDFDESGGYTRDLIYKATGVCVSNEWAEFSAYALVACSALISAWRLSSK